MALDRKDPAGELVRRLERFTAGEMTRDELVVFRDDMQEALRRTRPVLKPEQLQLFTESLVIIDRRLR